MGNNTTVSAGSQTLITNSFDLRTGRLLESTYGNGHKVATDYDNLDRVATYKVWNSATGQYEVKFRYGYDASGNLVVSYTYDTWGKLISTTGSLASTIGVKNPYRYRGYRYDTETGLYYLQSRYYNPDWGRFVNADGITGVEGELLTHNMFSYCVNNPVNMEDSSGYISVPLGLTAKQAIVIGISGFMALIKGSAAYAFLVAIAPYAVMGIAVGVVVAGAVSLAKANNTWTRTPKGDSGKLGRNMSKNGSPKPGGPQKYHAHHIVPAAAALFRHLAETLNNKGIDINSHVNGVWLEAKYHASMHTTKYLALLESKVNNEMSVNQIIKGLNDVRNLLQNGWLPK